MLKNWYADQCGKYCSKQIEPAFSQNNVYIYSAKTNMSFEVNIFVIYIYIHLSSEPMILESNLVSHSPNLFLCQRPGSLQ